MGGLPPSGRMAMRWRHGAVCSSQGAVTSPSTHRLAVLPDRQHWRQQVHALHRASSHRRRRRRLPRPPALGAPRRAAAAAAVALRCRSRRGLRSRLPALAVPNPWKMALRRRREVSALQPESRAAGSAL